MEQEDFICPVCSQFYDDTNRSPRMVPVCGHTICTTCICQLLAKIGPESDIFVCPEDCAEFSVVSHDINLFPKNFAIIKLNEKRKLKKTLSNEVAVNLTVNEIQTEAGTEESIGKAIQEDLSALSQDNLIVNSEPNTSHTICKEHNRKFELVCLDHKTRICASCALFGSHKNHDFRSEEEVFKEITCRAEALIDMFQDIDCKQNNFMETSHIDQLFAKVQKKYEDLSSQIHSAFDSFVDQIRTKERKVLEELSAHISDIGEYCKLICKLPQDVSDKVKRWKNNAQIKLASLGEKAEKGEVAFELLEDRYNLKEDVLANGEKILKELEKSSQETIKSVDNKLEKISITFSDIFSSALQRLCVLNWEDNSVETPEALTCDDDFYKRLLPSYDPSFLNLNKAKQQIKSMPQIGSNQEVGTRTLLEYSNLRAFDEDAHTSLSRRSQISQLTDDTNLLNFEANNFSMLEAAAHVTEQRQKPLQYSSEIWKANEGTPVNNAPILQRGFTDNQELVGPNDSSFKLGTSGSQPILVDITNIPLNSGIIIPNQLVLREKENSGEKTRLDLKNSSSKSNSQNNNTQNSTNNSLNLTPQEEGLKTKPALTARGNMTKRKTTLKVHEKFEPLIEGLRDGTLEVIDLTGAELGDVGVASLVEWLADNKKLKALKLVRNKISDEGFALILKHLAENTTLTTLNMTQNQLTEKSLDDLINMIKANATLKSIYFNQNLIKVMNVKSKIKELHKLGINVSI